MTTKTMTHDPDVRLFIAPINEPTRGRWIEIGPYVEDNIREEMQRVRSETGAEELRIADAEGLPRALIPKYGGVPAQKIAAFCELASEHGRGPAEAYIRVMTDVGANVAPEDWPRSMQDSYMGTQDSLEDWAEADIRAGLYPSFGDVVENLGWSYIDLDRIVQDLEMDGHYYHLDDGTGVHRFIADDL